MDSIFTLAKQLRDDVINGKQIGEDYDEFKSKYPKFYDMLTKKDMDEEMFKKLMNLLKNNVSSDQRAAAEFSKFGAEKYLYPQFGKPSENDMETAQNKIDKLS